MDFTVNRVEKHGEVQVVSVVGQLDAHSYHVLRDDLRELLEGGTVKIVLDCSALDYISSAGLGVLKQMRKDFREAGGDLHLSRLPEKIMNVFSLLGFSKIISVHGSNEDAVAAYKG